MSAMKSDNSRLVAAAPTPGGWSSYLVKNGVPHVRSSSGAEHPQRQHVEQDVAEAGACCAGTCR